MDLHVALVHLCDDRLDKYIRCQHAVLWSALDLKTNGRSESKHGPLSHHLIQIDTWNRIPYIEYRVHVLSDDVWWVDCIVQNENSNHAHVNGWLSRNSRSWFCERLPWRRNQLRIWIWRHCFIVIKGLSFWYFHHHFNYPWYTKRTRLSSDIALNINNQNKKRSRDSFSGGCTGRHFKFREVTMLSFFPEICVDSSEVLRLSARSPTQCIP